MLSKRIIACLDVRDGKLAKSVKFVDTKDIGDPVETARRYYEAGIDELVLYDITASSDQRNIMLDVVSAVAAQVFIPFSVGGGLRTVEDCAQGPAGRRRKGQRQHRRGAEPAADHGRLARIRRAVRRAFDGRAGGSARIRHAVRV